MDARQLGFGWTIEDHRDRDQRISRIYLPRSITVEDGAVAEDKVRFLLHRLNFHAQGDIECFPAVKTLAAEMGVEEKTVRRTIQACGRLGLVTVTRKKQRLLSCNHYRIEWPALEARAVRLHPELIDQTDIRTATNRTPVPPPNGHAEETKRTYVPLPPPPKRTPVPLTMVLMDGSKEPPPSARATDGGGGGFRVMRWGKERDERELHDDSRIDELFGAVVSCGFAHDTEEDRLRFAALIFNLRRQKVDRRFGLLTRIIEGKVVNKFVPPGASRTDWRNRATESDLDAARRALKQLDGLPAAQPAASKVVDVDAEEARDHQKNVDYWKSQLAAFAQQQGLK